MNILLFETELEVTKLHPITLGRPAFDILCGGTTLYQLVKKIFQNATIDWQVRDYLSGVTQQKFPREVAKSDGYCYLNATLVPSVVGLQELKKLTDRGEEFAVYSDDGRLLAAYTKQELPQPPEKDTLKTVACELPYLNKLWDIIFANEKYIGENVAYLSQFFAKQSGEVYYGRNVSVASNVVFDTANGAVILDDDVKVAEFCVLRGPLYIGSKSIIRAFSEFKDGCSIGPVCKLGGEVEAGIIQGYTNKQHYGFLGHSYVGEWVNLGAGTTNSDLKNTYGEIKMKGEPTGHQFLGCVIADYAKAAVGSMIYTGKVVGFNACIYGITAHDVPSFTNYARFGEKQVCYPLQLALKSQGAMFSRRQVEASGAYIELLTEVFEMTKKEREESRVREGELKL